MALTDYTIGPNNQIYYQGRPLPPELQGDSRVRQVAEQNSRGPGNARRPVPGQQQQPPPSRTAPTLPGGASLPAVPNPFNKPGGDFRYEPPTDYALGGGAPPAGGAAPPPGGTPAAPVDPNFRYEPRPDYPLGPDPNAPYQPKPGTPAWEQYRINDMLRQNGLDGWQVTSAAPAKDYAAGDRDSEGEPLPDATPSYIINVRNPQTNAIKQVVMNRVWQDDDGVASLSDPGGTGSSGYGYQLAGVKDQPGADTSKVGHSELHVIGTEMWGTNNQTGAFEKIPGAPPIPKDIKSWTDLRQVEDADGNLTWWGNDPKDGQMKPTPGMPVIPKEAKGYGNPYQVKQNDGSMVWYGIDPKTKEPVRIPNMPVTGPEPRGPGSITQGGKVYVQKADGSYAPASGVPDPNPPKGTPRIFLGNDGSLYQQLSNGDGTFSPDPTFAPVPFTDAAKQARGALGGQHQPGDPGVKIIAGVSYPVVYRGGGDENYDVVPADQGGKATPYPGALQPTAIATSNDQEFIQQRMPDGTIQSVRNQNYAPTDPAARVRQLSSLASAKYQELNGKIGPTYTPEQAQSDMDTWWSSNVQPAQQQIILDQQKQQSDLAAKGIDQQRANMATAQTAGQNATAAFTAGQTGRVGPNWDQASQAAGQGKFYGPEFDNSVTFSAPDPVELQKQAVMDALKYMSPSAAVANGMPMPNYAAIDPNAGLNRLQYSFGAPSAGAQLGPPPAAGPPGPPMPVAPPAAPLPPGTPGAPGSPGYDWNALFGRLADDRQLQQTQAAQWPPYSPIG